MKTHTRWFVIALLAVTGGALILCGGCAPFPVCARYTNAACHDVGENYRHGAIGYEKDRDKAVAYYRAACRRGFSRSCLAACDLDDAQACNQYGLHVVRRRHRKQWRKQARTAFERACKLGSFRGCGNVGKHILKGRQSAERMAQARAFLIKACEGGFQPACADVKKWAEPSPPPSESTAPEPSSAPPDENTTEAPPPQPESAPSAPTPTGCGEVEEISWVGFGSAEMVWCDGHFVLRTLDSKEAFRVSGGALGTEQWVHIGPGGKAVCVDFLSSRLEQKHVQRARCYVIDSSTALPTVVSHDTQSAARFAGTAWRVTAEQSIERGGVPTIRHAEGRFELVLGEAPSE